MQKSYVQYYLKLILIENKIQSLEKNLTVNDIKLEDNPIPKIQTERQNIEETLSKLFSDTDNIKQHTDSLDLKIPAMLIRLEEVETNIKNMLSKKLKLGNFKELNMTVQDIQRFTDLLWIRQKIYLLLKNILDNGKNISDIDYGEKYIVLLEKEYKNAKNTLIQIKINTKYNRFIETFNSIIKKMNDNLNKFEYNINIKIKQ
jgi:hypothetical protein